MKWLKSLLCRFNKHDFKQSGNELLLGLVCCNCGKTNLIKRETPGQYGQDL